ncbi:MAG TPA: hypothetical protein VMV84_06515 [Dehalococcoidales bacterium]|nr:hypothetical protein [Dehalococcoidales bacterium]
MASLILAQRVVLSYRRQSQLRAHRNAGKSSGKGRLWSQRQQESVYPPRIQSTGHNYRLPFKGEAR